MRPLVVTDDTLAAVEHRVVGLIGNCPKCGSLHGVEHLGCPEPCDVFRECHNCGYRVRWAKP